MSIVNGGGNGYETQQIPLFYVFVVFLDLDRALNTILVYY